MHQNEIRTAADVRAAGGLERLKENHSIVDVKEQHFRSSLRKHVWPGHEQAVLGARFEVKARAARPLSDPDTRKGSVMIRVDLLEHVDGAGPGRIDTLAGGVEPQVIDAEYAGKACNDRT